MAPRFSPFAPDRRALLAGAASFAALAACDRTEAPIDDAGNIRLRLALDRPAHADHGGFFQAVASGAYARRGLTVEILPSRAGSPASRLLADGQAELAVGDGLEVAGLVRDDAPVRAVAAYFQRSAAALFAHAGPPLPDLSALADRHLLIPADQRGPLWVWLQERAGLADDQLREDASDDAFRRDSLAVRPGDLVRDPDALARAAGFQPSTLLLADADYPDYGVAVLAPTAFARDNARALRAFLAGSAEGWRDYLQRDAAAAHTAIRRLNPGLSLPDLAAARNRIGAAGLVTGGDAALYGLGAMTAARWRAVFDLARRSPGYPADLDPRQAFTTQFLPGRS